MSATQDTKVRIDKPTGARIGEIVTWLLDNVRGSCNIDLISDGYPSSTHYLFSYNHKLGEYDQDDWGVHPCMPSDSNELNAHPWNHFVSADCHLEVCFTDAKEAMRFKLSF